MFWVFGSLHLPAVTSASEVLTQTYRSSRVVQWPARWALNPMVRKEQSYMTVCRIVRQNSTWTCPFPELGGIWEVFHFTPQERISEPIVFLNRCCFSSSASRTNCGNRDCIWGRLSTFPYVSLEISFSPSRLKNFPRSSSSSPGRLRQVAALRARPGEKFLMVRFPASLSAHRLAGSSDTQNVCRMTKSRNRTGCRAWRKSRARHPPAHAATSLHDLTPCQAAKVSG